MVNAPDLGSLLQNSDSVTGIQSQQRSSGSFDPRIRGYHVGQIATYGDGGFFLPARQDLDTAVSKFDPASVQDIVVIKGPYSVRYGPGFAFLDITSFGADPSVDGGTEVHGRTQLRYESQGRRWDGLQSLGLAGPDYGVRVTYDIRTAQDYVAGNDQHVPSSYNTQNTNFAASYLLSPTSKIEFKGLRSYQHDVEYPGYYFDINRLDTEAYSIRYTLKDQEYFDNLRLDLWYNNTNGNGDTHRGAKQIADNGLLNRSFNVVPGTFNMFQDNSTTNFNELSSGYRLLVEWGKADSINVAVGSDLNVVRQHLNENIRLLPLTAYDPTLGVANPFLTQNQQVPESRSIDPGLFIDGNVPLTKRLALHAGARVDLIYTSSDDRTITGNIPLTPGSVLGPSAASGVAPATMGDQTSLDPIIYSVSPGDPNLERHFTLSSYYINGDYKIDEHLKVTAGFGLAQRAPTLTELYASGPFVALLQEGTTRVIGDPHLSPETLKQFDVGFTGNYERARFSVNGFYSWIDNYITFDQNKTGNGINQVVFTNTDLATLAGGEIYAEVDATCWLTPFASLSYVDGEDRTHQDNRRDATTGRAYALASSRSNLATEALPDIAPLELRGGFRIHEATKAPNWSVEFLSRTVMTQDNVAASLGEQRTPGFTIFDIRAFWQINPHLLISGGVDNIGNKTYFEHLDPRGGMIESVGLLRPGSNYYVSAQLKY